MEYKEFKSIIEIAMYFSESMSLSEIEEYIQDWYVYYKESKFTDVREWIEFWFKDVSRDTHEYWIDQRGMFSLCLQTRTI
jgi:hypothetical protein